MRLIDADAMKADLLTVDPQYETMIQWCITVLDAQSTIEERKTGKWIRHPELEADGECGYECDQCGMGSDVDYNFCMRCGAKMIGDAFDDVFEEKEVDL